MWLIKKKIINNLQPILIDADMCLLRGYFPAGSFKERSEFYLEIFESFGLGESVWGRYVAAETFIGGVFNDGFYGSIDQKNLYKITKKQGVECLIDGIQDATLYNDEMFLIDVNEPGGIKLINVNTHEILWELIFSSATRGRSPVGVREGFDFIVIMDSDDNSWNALNLRTGIHLWSLIHLDGYELNSTLVIGDFLYLLYQQDRGRALPDGFKVYYRVLHVHNKNTGKLVRVYENVPGYSGLNAHRPTGGLYICGADVFYSIQPMVDDEFCSHPVLIDGVDSIFAAKVVGFNDTQIMLYAHRYYREDPLMHTYGIVHFDVITKQFVYGQALERIYGRNPKIEIQQAFMFVTDENSEMSIFKWETDV